MSSNFGTIFKITTWGESHGDAVGVVIDGCPAGIEIDKEEIQLELQRRKPGQSRIVTPRKEDDICEILSGVFNGKSTGTPISILVKNQNQRSKDYEEIASIYRPSHADFTYETKYGLRDWRGGGRASARETIGRVAAGAIARKVLVSKMPQFKTIAYVKQVGKIFAEVKPEEVLPENVESNIVRAPNPEIAKEMEQAIKQAKREGDSLGGVIECIVKNEPNLPIGLGEPIFDKLEADLAKAMMSLPATKGFEIGSGFAGTELSGSQHNDEFMLEDGTLRTRTNHSGGIQGGISNGENIIFRVAFKPTATILKEQSSVAKIKASGKPDNGNLQEQKIKVKGRHDPCVLPRAVPIVEAMTNIVLCDHYLRMLVNLSYM